MLACLLRLKQPRVLDGDDGLVREGLNQFNLLLRKWRYLRAVQDQNTEDVAITQQRYCDHASEVAKALPVAALPVWLGKYIWNVHSLAIEHYSTNDAAATRCKSSCSPPLPELIGESKGGSQ